MSMSAVADKGIAEPDPSNDATEQPVGERVEQGATTFVELPAPEGWKKKLIPKSEGSPRKNEVIFVSPIGEEIRNKRRLSSYLKSHPGGPSASQFDWNTGETPRRSSRISEKTKTNESLEEPPQKRPKKSSTKTPDEKKVTSDEEPDEAHGEESGVAATDGTKQNIAEKTEATEEIAGLEKAADEVVTKEDYALIDPKEKIPDNTERTEESQKEHPQFDANVNVPAEGELKGEVLVNELVQQTKDAEGGAGGEVKDTDDKQNGYSEKEMVIEDKLGEGGGKNRKEYCFDENVARKDLERPVAASLCEGEAEMGKILGANGTNGDLIEKGADYTVASSAPGM